MYLYYCYRLGYLPKYKKQNNARLHYLLKDDLMKLDKITDEVRLLGRENISTDEQLFSYKTSLEEQMKNLIAGNKKWISQSHIMDSGYPLFFLFFCLFSTEQRADR